MIKVSDYVIKFFENKNIDSAFTVSGGGCIHLIDSLRKSKSIKTYCVHHEQSALMASEPFNGDNMCRSSSYYSFYECIGVDCLGVHDLKIIYSKTRNLSILRTFFDLELFKVLNYEILYY
jgi:hypothetical protein